MNNEWKDRFIKLVEQVRLTRGHQKNCEKPHMKSEWLNKKTAERNLDALIEKSIHQLTSPQTEIFN
jgi:hypothetical protein